MTGERDEDGAAVDQIGREQPGAGAGSLWAFVVRAKADAGLRDLPVVGPHVPQEVDIRLRGLHAAAAARPLTAPEVERANKLLLGVASEDTTLALPDGEMKGRAQFGIAVEVGGKQRLLCAPVGAGPKPSHGDIVGRDGAPVVSAAEESGTAWYPFGRGLGPIRLERLGIRYADGTVWLLVDAELKVQGLTLSGRGMGLGVRLDDPARISGTLEGLGLAWSKPPIEVAGALISRHDPRYSVLIQGAATVKTPALELAAVGGYAQRKGEPPSMFVFGRLVFGSGQGLGPPPFRITGAAAGFGYNSAVRVPELYEVEKFPLMPGGSTSTDPLVMLEELTGSPGGKQPWLSESRDHLWLAAGIEFDSFQFVHGRILGVAQFSTSGSQDFSAMLLGRAWADFPKGTGAVTYAHVDVVLAATYESKPDVLKVFAALADGSFVVHPSCKLSGQAAFCVWFGRSAHPGDFVLSLGGYHPRFTPPDHYPRPKRLALDWSVSDQVSVHGSCYAALTPSAFMVGAQLELSFHAGPIKAWCRAGLDALVQWDPFSFSLSMKVEVGVSIDIWPYFSGSLGVSLDAWGPPTGGIATVHVLAWDFDIRFGDPRPTEPELLEWKDFSERVLPQPVADALPVAGTVPGPGGETMPEDGTWIAARQGFTFATRSVVPVQKVRFGTATTAPDGLPDGNPVDIRPVGAKGVSSTHRVTLKRGATVIDPVKEKWKVTPEDGRVPLGLWGTPLPADKQPALPTAGEGLVPARTGVRFAAPAAELAGGALVSTEERLGTEKITGPPVPLSALSPVAHAPDRPGDVRADLEDHPVGDRDRARRELLGTLAASGVIPRNDDLEWAAPFPRYCRDVRSHLRTEPMRQQHEEA
ncbi:DUF6603 domain-containing protein [Streptomyces sp. NBC_01477]|uniref:DUF6603 domain-containing protein n=1 Tax=Streptomyces sp. NBC_01477 TaxID=2976015 RepID=UPI002E2FC668|nr:DUF6603 domain-containing protein [Streptomyces sp. NBC_01477]